MFDVNLSFIEANVELMKLGNEVEDAFNKVNEKLMNFDNEAKEAFNSERLLKYFSELLSFGGIAINPKTFILFSLVQ